MVVAGVVGARVEVVTGADEDDEAAAACDGAGVVLASPSSPTFSSSPHSSFLLVDVSGVVCFFTNGGKRIGSFLPGFLRSPDADWVPEEVEGIYVLFRKNFLLSS